MFKRFDHIGVPHKMEREGEVWIDGMKLWLINPDETPFRYEYLRFREDTWFAEEVQTQIHIAVEVDKIADVLPLCEKILHEKIVVNENLTIAFVIHDGVLLELMEYK